jgi:hypothetical protein
MNNMIIIAADNGLARHFDVFRADTYRYRGLILGITPLKTKFRLNGRAITYLKPVRPITPGFCIKTGLLAPLPTNLRR